MKKLYKLHKTNYIIMFLKKLSIVIFLFISASIFAGCSDILKENPKHKPSPKNTFTNTKGFQTAINGLYAHTQHEWDWKGTLTYAPLFIGTDLARTGNEINFYMPFALYGNRINSTNSVANAYWDWCYKGIAAANQILFYSKKETVKWAGKDDKKRIQAEARFHRAYYYYYLATLFGGVPLVTHYNEEIRFDFKRSPQKKVLKLIVKDLEFAAQYLPLKAKDGKLTKGAANHFLALVYLTLDKPVKAEKSALKVINSGVYHLMKQRFGNHLEQPGDVFSDLFLKHNQNRSSGNMETIWAIQLEYDVKGGGGSLVDWSRRVWVPYYSSVSGMILADSLGGRGLGRAIPTDYWFNLYKKGDMRASKYNIRRKYYYNDPASPKYGQQVNITKDMIEAGKMYASTTKFDFGVIKEGGSPSYLSNMKDRIKFRLAGTYLLLAEAQFKQGKLAQAAASINKVRARANASLISAEDVTLDFILDERARELFGEFPRRITLVRTGTLIERVNRYNSQSSGKIRDYHVLWPIPQSAIDANKEHKLKQNPGY